MFKSTIRLAFVCLVVGLCLLLTSPRVEVSALVDASSGISAISPNPLSPSMSLNVTFDVFYSGGTYAGEYMDRFEVTLPATWTINSVSHTNPNSNPPCTGVTSTQGHTGQLVYWQTIDGSVPDCGAWMGTGGGQHHYFTVNVSVPSCSGSPWSFPWHIDGDGFEGALSTPPHERSGTFSSLSCVANPAFSASPAVPGPLAMGGLTGVAQSTSFSVSNTGTLSSLLNVNQVSLTGGYTVSGLPISGLGTTAAAQTVTAGCTPGTSPATGTLVVQTNEPGAPSYTYNLTCTQLVAVFSGSPAAPGPLTMDGPPGAAQTGSISVTNTGSAGTTLDVTQVSLTSGYTISGLPISGLGTTGPAQTITTGCTPGTSPATGTLVIQTNEVGTPSYTYNLSCAALLPAFSGSPAAPGPLAMASPTSTPQSASFSVSNTGMAGSLLDVAQVSLTAGYTLDSGLPISGQTTTAAAATVTVGCTPGTSPATGTLVIQTNESGTPSYTYNLSCTLLVPTLSASPAAPGPLAMSGPGGVGQTASFTVSNTGPAGSLLDVTQVSLTSDYTISGLPITGQTTTAAASTITVGCTPGTSPASGTLVIQTNESGTPSYTYNLTCTQLFPTFTGSPAPTGPLAMAGPGGVGQTASFTVSNSGPAGSLLDVTQVSLTSDYTISGLPITGQTTTAAASTITVGCTPGTSPATGSLVIQTNESGTPSYTYTLTCTQLFPTFTGSPAPTGPLAMAGPGGVGQTASFTVSNTGPAGSLLDVSQVSLTGGYTLSSGLPIAAQTTTAAAQTVTVGCTPGTSPASGALVIQTNESGAPSYTYNLTCTQLFPTFTGSPAAPGPLAMAGVIGTPQTASFTVSNSGPAGSLLDVAQVSLTAGYTLNSGLPITAQTSTAAAQTVTVGCTPGTSPAAGTLVIQTNESGTPSYTYTLTCTYPLPAFSASPAAPGPLTMAGVIGAPQTASFAVSNTGAAGSLLNVAQVSLTAGYTLTSGLPITGLGTAGPAQTVTIGCMPGTSPTAGTLVIQSNETGAPTYTYNLTCTYPLPAFSAIPTTPGPLSMMGVIGAPQTASFAVSNSGAVGSFLDVAQVSLTAGYALTGGLPITGLGTADPAATVTVGCTPGTSPLAGTLVIQTNETGTPSYTYNLTCTYPLPAFSASPAAPGPLVMSGPSGVGQSTSFSVSNTGAAGSLLDVAQVSLTAGYTLTGGLPITGLGTTDPASTVTIGCTPGTTPTTGTLVIQSNETGAPTYSYTLYCTLLLPGYSSSPAAPGGTIDVGSVTLGTARDTTLSVQEVGGLDLHVSDPLFGGPNAAEFSLVSPALPFTIADGGPAQPVVIRCAPGALGLRTATLQFTTDDPANPTVDYTLTCTGVAAPVAPTADEDRDDDGLINSLDNCPDAYNPDQRDSDLNGVGDLCQDCPNSRLISLAYTPAALPNGGGIYCRATPESLGYLTPLPPAGTVYACDTPYECYYEVFGIDRGGYDFDPLGPVEVCFAPPAAGSLAIARYRSFPPTWQATWELLTTYPRNGLVCAQTDRLSEVALLRSDGSVAPGTGTAGSPAAPSAACTVVTTHIVTFRGGPSADAPQVASPDRIPYQTRLTASAQSGGWYRVTYLGVEGWVSGEFVQAEAGCAGLPTP